MALFGSSWKEEPTNEEVYKEITGNGFIGSKKDLVKQIEKDCSNNYTSKTERSKLMDLQAQIEPENK